MYGWRDAVNLQHTEACRARIEAELAKTDKGVARIKLSKSRFEKRQAAADVAEDQKDHGKEEEKAAAEGSQDHFEKFDDLEVPRPLQPPLHTAPDAPLLQPSAARRGAAPPVSAKVADSPAAARVSLRQPRRRRTTQCGKMWVARARQ